MTWDPADLRAAVQAELDAFVDEQAVRLAPLGDDAEQLVTAAREAVGGGKRCRAPNIVCVAGRPRRVAEASM